MSTMSSLNTAYSGLVAAKAALDVTGQNVANVNTAGYTRQRVEQVALAGVGAGNLTGTRASVGAGASVTGVVRVADAFADAQVRTTASSSGYWSAASSALSTVETSLNEPSDSGLSNTLTSFWNAWSGMANSAGDSSAGLALIGKANQLTSALASGYSAAAGAWTGARTALSGAVSDANQAAQRVASLNDTILKTTAQGGNANELIDQRNAALNTLSTLVGATTRTNPSGTVDVLVGGRTMVSGSTVKALSVTGAGDITAAGSAPVRLTFAGDTATVQPDGGSVAAQVASLAAANGGTGGVYAEAAATYNALATTLHDQINALTTAPTAQSANGTASPPFFGYTGSATAPAALALTVLPTSVNGIGTAATTEGKLGNSVAAAVAALGSAAGSPDSMWAGYVSRVGTQSQSAQNQSTLATAASTSATTAQTSASGVDLDEETSNLVIYQHAYQGAARVMTAVDQMLDTLINHTGIVGNA